MPPIEVMTVTELEQGVIEAAIEYVQQSRNGRYRDVPRCQTSLFEAVDELINECEGRWPG